MSGMSPEELKDRLDGIASQLWAVADQLEPLYPLLTRQDDRRALREMLKDLHWACENCSVIGLHQIGQALGDNMGYGEEEGFRLGDTGLM